MLNLSEIKNSKFFITQIIKGATFLSVGTIIYALCNFAFKYLLLHTWSPQEYGIFMLIITIVGILGVFTEFNLNVTTTIFLARDLKNPENKKTLISVLISFLLLILICLCITLTIIYFTNFNTPVLETFRHYFDLIWLLVILMGITAISYGLVRAYRRMDYEAISKVISGLVIVGTLALIVYAFSKCSIEFSVVILIISQISAFLVVIFFLLKKRVVSINPYVSVKKVLEYLKKIKLSDISSVLTFSFYVSGIVMLTTLLFSIDKFMIPSFLSIEMLGFYGGAYFIVAIPKIITNNLAVTLLAFVPEKDDNVKDAKREYFAFLILFLFFAVIGYSLFIYFVNFSLILLPTEYNWITPIIQILLVGMLFSDVFVFNSTFICSLRKEKVLKQMMAFFGFVVIINIVLNYMFIPKLGIEGAAMATAISFILIAVISMVQVIKLR